MDEENKNALPQNEEEKKGENGMHETQSEASLASLDVTNEVEVGGNEEEEEEKDPVVLGPVVGLKEQLEKDKVLIFCSNLFLIVSPFSLIRSFENSQLNTQYTIYDIYQKIGRAHV